MADKSLKETIVDALAEFYVDHLKVDFEGINQRLDKIEGRQGGMEDRQTRMEDRQTRMEADITHIKRDVKDIKADLSLAATHRDVHAAIHEHVKTYHQA